MRRAVATLLLALASCQEAGGGGGRCDLTWGLPIAPVADTIDRAEVGIGGTSTSCVAATVSWRNDTTGAAGTVVGALDKTTRIECYPLFGCFGETLCSTSYQASVPLAMGANTLELEEVGARESACQRFTVTRVPDTTPPAVAAQVLGDAPGAGSASVRFTEPVDCATARSAVTLSREGIGALDAVMTCSGDLVELSGFTLEPLGRYTLSVSTALADLAGNLLASAYRATVLVHTPGPPEIASVSPADVATAVPVDAAVEVVFTWPIDPATATATSFQLSVDAVPVAADMVVDGTTVTLRPRVPLTGQTTYVAEVTATLAGVDGQPIAVGRRWSFTTRDVIAPEVVALIPPDGFRNFDPDLAIAASFSEPVEVAPGAFKVVDTTGAPVAGSVVVDANRARFVPSRSLPAGGTFTAVLGAATDLAGNALAAPATWSFTVVGPGVGTWRSMATIGAPSPRRDFAWAWTGTELLVWGGRSIPSGALLGDGARYDPRADAWRPMAGAGAPTPRARPIAAFSGTELLVWGGEGVEPGVFSGTGGRYDPTADFWLPMAVSGVDGGIPWSAPTPRAGAAVAWTGSELVVLGGLGCLTAKGCPWGYVLGDGGQYLPAADRWRPTTGVAASYPAFAWTGNRLLVFGSNGVGGGTTSLAWDPVTLQGVPLAGAGMPVAPYQATGAFTGSEFLVWGGRGAAGEATSRAAYAPSIGAWRTLSTANEPPGGVQPAAVWTGTRLLVWGGGTRTGGLYDPLTDRWETTALEGAPSIRSGHAGAWTGSELLIWGGDEAGAGGRYSPP